MHLNGTTVCRSHCNVDPVSKLGNLEPHDGREVHEE
jgi:hypothetical protein